MANSRTLVYVLAFVVCGGCSNGSFWVSANTVPLLKEPVALRASSPQHQTHLQQHRVQQQLPIAQQIQETSRTSSQPSPSPATAVVAAQPQHKSPGTSLNNNNNNAPPTYSIKNAWGLTAGSSDSGPYTSGYGYISGRTLQQPTKTTTSKRDYDLLEKQSTPSLFSGIIPAMQGLFGHGLDLKSIVFGGLMTYGITNFGVPESINTLIPVLKYFRSKPTVKSDPKVTVSKAAPLLKEAPEPSETKIVKEIPDKMDEATETKVPIKLEDNIKPVVVTPPKEANATTSRRKRDTLIQPDTDLTELAAMVLSAIQSGECMQRSICLLGSQIGASNKGRAAFTLVDKLVPESVQGNQYFVTLKKALRGGESFCDRFRCRFN